MYSTIYSHVHIYFSLALFLRHFYLLLLPLLTSAPCSSRYFNFAILSSHRNRLFLPSIILFLHKAKPIKSSHYELALAISVHYKIMNWPIITRTVSYASCSDYYSSLFRSKLVVIFVGEVETEGQLTGGAEGNAPYFSFPVILSFFLFYTHNIH